MRKQILTNYSLFLALMVMVPIHNWAQLPSEYATKVSYHEKKEVTYSVHDEADLNCLTYRELSEYHGHMQFYTIDEYVDLRGNVLLDKNFIEEKNVRDNWTESFRRITVGKNTIDVYDSDGQLFYQKERSLDSSHAFLTPLESTNYGFLDLGLDYYDSLKVAYTSLGFTVTENNKTLTATSIALIVTFDHKLKIASVTEFDSLGIKVKETVVEYALNQERDTYFPKTETIYEWISTDNGCCVRKVTVYTRFEFDREVLQGRRKMISKRDNKPNLSNEEQLELVQILNQDAFIIHSKKHQDEVFEFTIFDMAGRILLEGQAVEGVRIHFPKGYRVGVYVIYLKVGKSKYPVIKKIVKNNSGSKF
jgi:hypothetical protein